MNKILTDYTQRHADDNLLGHVVLFSQREAAMSYNDLTDLLHTTGLTKWAPKAPSDPDVFRRVSTAAQVKRIATADPDKYCNLLVRDVASTGDELERRIVCETVDSKGKRLDYREDWSLTFHKPSGTVGIRKLSGFASPADQVAHDIVDRYQKLRGTVDGNCLRTLVTRVLEAHNAVAAKPTGGADFISRQHAGIVGALEEFSKQAPGSWFWAVPLPDTPAERDKLTERVTSHTNEEIDRLLAEMRQTAADGGELSAAKFAALNQERKRLAERAEAYVELLDDNLESTKARLSILDQVVTNLSRQVKAAA